MLTPFSRALTNTLKARMKNKRKLLIILCAVIITATAVVVIAKIFSTPAPPEKNTDISVPPVVDAQIQTQYAEQSVETVSQRDLSIIKGCYWYLYDESSKDCYVFGFSDNNRVDVNYLKYNATEFENGYSVYSQDGDNVILKYLPDCIPTKHFTFTIKDNELYFENTKLEKNSSLSKEIINKHFS